jgi:hypothetical protein
MALKRLEEFRLYYNQTIQPELLRMERERLRLVVFMAVSLLLITGVIVLELYIDVLLLTLMLSIPLGIYVVFLWRRMEEFRQRFKPRIVRLILDFIDDGLNFDPSNPLQYFHDGYISKDRFMASRLFDTPAQEYKGEDKIEGKVGEMFFELSELRVGEISVLRNRLNAVFSGVFLHAVFNEPTIGAIVVWPRSRQQFLTSSVRAFTFEGGKSKDDEILNADFKRIFMTYATEDTAVAHILSPPMQEALVQFTQTHRKDLFISFLNRDIHLGLWEDKDLLEPYILSSNLSFDRIREFFEDIHSLLHLVEVFDQTH